MKPFMKALVQALFLANLALTLTLLGGHLRSSYASADSQDPTPIEAGTSQKLPTITVAEAARHLDAKDAIFVDARHPDSFKEGHIPTAVSVPAGEEVSAGTIQRLRSPKLLIAYCDGPTCGAAEEVAQELWVKGLTNVTVMTDGWPAWTAAGLPVLEGSEEATADPPTPRPSPEAPTASLVEFAPPVLNLGQARPGQILKGQVEYKNVSRRPLHIARSETSCGCTEGLYSKPSLQPGESGVLTVGFKSKGRQGAARGRTIAADIQKDKDIEITDSILQYYDGNVKDAKGNPLKNSKNQLIPGNQSPNADHILGMIGRNVTIKSDTKNAKAWDMASDRDANGKVLSYLKGLTVYGVIMAGRKVSPTEVQGGFGADNSMMQSDDDMGDFNLFGGIISGNARSTQSQNGGSVDGFRLNLNYDEIAALNLENFPTTNQYSVVRYVTVRRGSLDTGFGSMGGK